MKLSPDRILKNEVGVGMVVSATLRAVNMSVRYWSISLESSTADEE
jgi:hypothetical protein